MLLCQKSDAIDIYLYFLEGSSRMANAQRDYLWPYLAAQKIAGFSEKWNKMGK
jgi:hypothetical protein